MGWLSDRLGNGGRGLAVPRPFKIKKESIEESVFTKECLGGSCDESSRHIVIVMDGMRDFTAEPLEWTLKNIVTPGCTVTILGIMPWLNIPLSSKMWLDVWPLGFEELPILEERTEWKLDVRYLKLQALRELCRRYEVVPHKEVVMGYPTRLIVVEKITSLHATWVVFDRYYRKNKEFYTGRIPCNMVMMNESGEADMIKGRSTIDISKSSCDLANDESPSPSPATAISDHLSEIRRDQVPEKQEKDPE